MKKFLLFVIALLFAVTGSWAATYYVATTGNNTTGDGSLGNPWQTIQYAIGQATDDDVIQVAAGTYVETGQILINKSLTIQGAGETTIIKPDADYSVGDINNPGNSNGWFNVINNTTFNLSDIKLDGTGWKVGVAVYFLDGGGTVSNSKFTNIEYEPSSTYRGTGILVEPSNLVNITGCNFTQMGRDGIRYRGTGTVSGNTYTGKGTGLWLDYFILAEFGSNVTISNNTVTNCLGVANDGSTSSGIAIWDDPNTTAILSGNILTNNTSGIGFEGINSTIPSWPWPVATIGAGNVITGGNYGIVFGAWGTTYTPVVTFGATTLKGQALRAISMDADIAPGTSYDIASVIFKDGAENVITDNYAKEDLVIHAIDAGNRGLFVWNASNVYVTPNSYATPTTTAPAIQRGIAAASANWTVNVNAGTYTEIGQIVINKNLSIIGADKTTTIIKPAQGTTGAYLDDPSAWIVVNSGMTFNLSNVTLDGVGQLICNGIISHGFGTINNNIIKNIKFYESGPDYSGAGIALFGANMTISNNHFSEIGREGIFAKYSTTTVIISGNVFVGKGAGNWLDYAIELSTGATATISNNTISGNIGVAIVDGSTSAGILISSYGGVSNATITNCTLTGNFEGISVGVDASDVSVVIAHHNSIYGNTSFGIANYGTTNTVNAENNYWGTITASGVAAKVNGPADYDPWCNADFSVCSYTASSAFYIVEQDVYLPTLQAAIDAALDGEIVQITAAGSYGGITYNNAGQTVTVTNTSGGTVTINGASPALTVIAGDVIFETGITFSTATDDPTILVTGGSLKLRNCTIIESTAFGQAGVRVEGGTVDLGIALDHGENTFVTGDGSKAVDNTVAPYVNAIGNYWGGTDYFDVYSKISGNVYFDPWCNSNFSNCTYSTSNGPITKAGKVVDLTGSFQVPVYVNSFNNIDAISLKLLFDHDILEWATITPNPLLAGMTADVFVGAGDDPDTLNFGFISLTPKSLTLADSLLVTITFTRLAPGTTLLQWDDSDPAYCEYQNFNIQHPYNDIPFATYYKKGFVTDMSVTFSRDYALNNITANVLGGGGGYIYDWSGPAGFTGDGTATITPVLYSYGTYTVTITDALGAVLSGSYYYGPVHNENMDIDYATINAAITAGTTANGHTISVDPGTYPENVVVNKQLIIKKYAATKPVILASAGIAVEVTADNVTIDGFEIKHSTITTLADMGIRLNTCDNSIIQNNYFTLNSIGIQVLDAGNNDILANEFNLNAVGIYFEGTTDGLGNFDGGGNGPFYSLSLDNDVIGNNIHHSILIGVQGGLGIYLDAACEDNEFVGNQIHHNQAIGYYAWKASNNIINENTISTNGMEGIELQGSSGNNILRNTVSGNPVGFYMRSPAENATDNTITNNFITGNGIGIKMQDDYTTNNWPGILTGNTIENNDISGNTGFGIQVLDVSPTTIISANCNWWGTGINAVDGPVDFIPYLNSGTDNDGATPGFQPAAGTCITPTELFVNDDNANGPYSSAVGDDNNLGTVSAPFRTIQRAIYVAAGGTVAGEMIMVDRGNYPENVNVNKSKLLIKGANYGIAGVGSRGLESIIDAGSVGGQVPVTIIASNVQLDGFTVQNSGLTGVEAGIGIQGVTGCSVKNNIVSNNFAGIALAGSTLNTVQDNALLLNYFGIYVGTDTYPSTVNTITGNNVATSIKIPLGNGNFSGDGIYVDKDCNGNIFTVNNVHNNAKDGFYLWKSATNTITGNTVTANAASGFELLGSANNTITENIVSGNLEGFSIRNSASYASSPNSINGNSISGNTGYEIFAETDIAPPVDATCNWYGLSDVAGVTAEINGPVTYDPWLAIGTDNDLNLGNGFQQVPGNCYGMKDIYVNDGSTTDDFYTPVIGVDAFGRGTQPLPYRTITYAVDKAMVGSNIRVDAGIYQEQVQIGKTLNMTGVDSVKTIVLAPATMSLTGYWYTATPSHPVMYAFGDDNTVNISKLCINGDGGRAVEYFIGMEYYDADGTFDQCKITGIHEPGGFTGAQRGHAFYGFYTGTGVQTLNITNNLLIDYQKGGIYVDGAGANTDVLIHNNTVRGQGVPHVTAQNGISPAWCDATITNNLVTGNVWNKVEHPHGDVAAGIVPYQTYATTITGNTMNGNEVALFGYQVGTPAYGINTFNDNKIHVLVDAMADVNPGNVYDKTVLNGVLLPTLTNIVYGCIQYAVDEADPLGGDVLNASDGIFIEKVTIHTPVDLRGPNYGTCGSATRVDEAIVMPPDNDPDYVKSLVNVEVNNVSIDGFKFEGNNPAIPGGTPVGGVDANVCTAIASAPDVVDGPFAQINHLSIRNNILQDFVWPGIYLECNIGTDQSYNYITCNKFDNMWEGIQNYAVQTSITGNTFDNLDRAISYHQVSTDGDGFLPEISDNIINIDWRSDWDENSAIWINGRLDPAPPLVLDNNVITCDAIPGGKNFRAIQVLNVQDTRQLTMTDNIVNGEGLCLIGLKIMNSASPNISFTNGHLLEIKDIGVLAENYYTNAGEPSWNGPGVVNLTLGNTEITMAIPGTGTGVMASAVPGFTQAATVNVINNCDISGGAIGILANGIGAKANVNNNTTTITNNLVGIKIDNGAELASCTYNTITNNSQAGILIESDAGAIGAIENNTISGNGNMTLPNHGIGLQNDKAATVDASPNWWGDETGPYNTPLNLCGEGNAVIGLVTFSPWFYQAAMSSLNGVPALTPSAIPDISTVTKTPIIVSTTITYPVLTGYDPAILTDAILSTTATAFPAGTKVIEVVFNDHVNPVMTIPVSYDLSTGNSHYLSTILGNPSPYGTPLVAHSGLIIDWKFTIEGATAPITNLPVSIQSVSYLDRTLCNNTLGNPELFTLTYADASLVLTTAPAPVCYPAGEATLNFNLIHPSITPVSGIIRSNAIIESDKELPVGTTIDWIYNPGGGDEASGTFVSTIATSTLYLSQIVTNNQAVLLSPNLFGHTGTIPWTFTVSNLAPGTYNFDIQAAAQLLNGTLYPYATMAPPLKIVVAGALNVNVLPVASISTVTSTPVILPVTVAYPDLAAQAVDPTILTDARISTTSGFFPAGARIFRITYEGGEILPFTPYVFGASQNEVFLSDILGGASPLLNHSNLTIDWEIFIDDVLSPVIIPLKVEAIAYVNKTVCYSIMDTEIFSLTFANASQALTGTYTVCATDPLVVNSTTAFPTINVDGRVKSDAKIITSPYFTAGTLIAISHNGDPYGTYTVPIAGIGTLYVSEMLGAGPNPLASESGKPADVWTFSITNLAYGVYNITVYPMARLTQTIPVTYTDYAYDTDNATLTKLNCGLSGKLTYHNISNTAMNNVGVELWKGGSKKYPITGTNNTDGSGNYGFSDVAAGTYEVRFFTAKPTGSINVTDAAQVNHWQTSPYLIEKVRFFAGDVTGNTVNVPNNYLSAPDAQLIQGHFVEGLPFNRVPWSFWRAGETINAHPGSEYDGYIYPTVTVATGTPSLTNINFYGMATGDFNRSFVPGSAKAGTEHLTLTYSNDIKVSAASDFELPVYSLQNVTVGAVSIILNFPADLVEVTGVSMNNGGILDWAVKGNELRIGWLTQAPISLSAGAELLRISLHTTAAFTTGKEIRFELANDILNELADEYFEMIPDGSLAIAVAASSTYGIGEQVTVENISLSNFPNPFRDYTNITYALPFEGRVTLEVYSILGTKVASIVNARQATGIYTVEYLTGTLKPCVYVVSLKLESGSQTLVRSIKIVRN